MQGECDRQTTKVIHQLQEERMVDHKVRNSLSLSLSLSLSFSPILLY